MAKETLERQEIYTLKQRVFFEKVTKNEESELIISLCVKKRESKNMCKYKGKKYFIMFISFYSSPKQQLVVVVVVIEIDPQQVLVEQLHDHEHIHFQCRNKDSSK